MINRRLEAAALRERAAASLGKVAESVLSRTNSISDQQRKAFAELPEPFVGHIRDFVKPKQA